MIEAIAESDDHLFAKFVEGTPISEKEIMEGIRKATITQKIFPVICGSAFKNKGVQNLLDSVVDYLPSPVDIPPVQGVLPDNPEITEELPATDDRAVFGAGVQDHDRPVCRPTRVYPCVLGPASRGRIGVQRRQEPQRARGASGEDARQQARRYSGNPGRRHLRGGV